MAQTVFDVGDPITSRFKLGVIPDGTTNVTVTVTRPDGGVIAGLTMSGWLGTDGDERTVQWYATNDGTSGGAIDVAYGDWLAVWKVVGQGASVSAKVYSVYPLPGQGALPPWQPFLREVADYVPWLTLSTAIPGGDTFLGTFTGDTYPSDEQAVRHIERVVRPISLRWPDLASSVYEQARTYVVLRSAASLARAYPRTSGDTATAADLDKQADAAWKLLESSADDTTTSPTGTGQSPIWAFPEPVAWGDQYL
jgi:hypothetical protein